MQREKGVEKGNQKKANQQRRSSSVFAAIERDPSLFGFDLLFVHTESTRSGRRPVRVERVTHGAIFPLHSILMRIEKRLCAKSAFLLPCIQKSIFARLFEDFTEILRVSMGFTQFFRVFDGFYEVFRVTMGFTEFLRIFMSFMEQFFRDVLRDF